MKSIFNILILSLMLTTAVSCNSNKDNGGNSSDENLTAGQINQKAGEKYMQEIMKKDKDFKQTSSGVAYKVIKEGEGENFKETDIVDVIYEGKLINGKVFDRSNGKAVPFSAQQVVPGFREVLTLMKPGSKVIAIIPGDLAYGDRGQNGIGPRETLIFEIETVGIHKDDAPAINPVQEEEVNEDSQEEVKEDAKEETKGTTPKQNTPNDTTVKQKKA